MTCLARWMKHFTTSMIAMAALMKVPTGKKAHHPFDSCLDGLRFNDVHNGIHYRGFDIGKLVFDMFPKPGGSSLRTLNL